MIFMSFSLSSEYRPEECVVDVSTPVHPVAPPFVFFTLAIPLFHWLWHDRPVSRRPSVNDVKM